ncbi:SH3 domain-binding glutamic acid-rich protein-like protein, partial [Stegodyphus mimosarum]
MVIKVYISGISGNHEIRKHQQRVLFILSSLKIDFEIIDITEIGKEEEREFMRNQCKLHKKENPLPPQIFNNDDYCGDYEDFETANEDNELMFFLKLKNKLSSEDSDEEKKEMDNQPLNNVETGESEALKA